MQYHIVKKFIFCGLFGEIRELHKEMCKPLFLFLQNCILRFDFFGALSVT